jgi:hypothetical protein
MDVRVDLKRILAAPTLAATLTPMLRGWPSDLVRMSSCAEP